MIVEHMHALQCLLRVPHILNMFRAFAVLLGTNFGSGQGHLSLCLVSKHHVILPQQLPQPMWLQVEMKQARKHKAEVPASEGETEGTAVHHWCPCSCGYIYWILFCPLRVSASLEFLNSNMHAALRALLHL